MTHWPWLYVYMNQQKGQTWWFRLFGRGFILKGPKSRALFSERHGMRRRLSLGGGWRILYLAKSPEINERLDFVGIGYDCALKHKDQK